MANRNNAGWLILAAALAVPGFMFYQWWTHLNAQSKADLEKRVRNRLPAGQQVFGHSPSQQKLSNPIAAAERPAAPAPAETSAAPVASAPPQAAALPQPVEEAAMPLPAADASAAAAASAPAASSILQTGPIAQIVLARDPMLSPFDVVRIAEAEARARRAQEELDAAAQQKKQTVTKKKVVREPPPETLVDLQGIVSTESGDKAIVNGEVVGEGDQVGNVKVLKISPTGVVFAYRNKRFIKGVNK